MRVKSSFAVLLATVACTAAFAQLVPTDPDWRESDVPTPPAVRTEGLVPVDVAGSALRWGVDPASISVGADGIVRYVVVATSDSGAVNAFYEGLRCSHAEVKVYARYATGSGWNPARDAQWRPVYGTSWRHSAEIAKGGACTGRAPNRSASQIVRDLQSTPNWHRGQ